MICEKHVWVQTPDGAYTVCTHCGLPDWGIELVKGNEMSSEGNRVWLLSLIVNGQEDRPFVVPLSSLEKLQEHAVAIILKRVYSMNPDDLSRIEECAKRKDYSTALEIWKEAKAASAPLSFGYNLFWDERPDVVL